MTRDLLHGKNLNNILDNQGFMPDIKKELKIALLIGTIVVSYLILSSEDYKDKNQESKSTFYTSIIQDK